MGSLELVRDVVTWTITASDLAVHILTWRKPPTVTVEVVEVIESVEVVEVIERSALDLRRDPGHEGRHR